MRAMETNALLLTAALAADPGWSWERTVRPAHPEPLAFGAAVASAGGALWIGPARDQDIGDGPPWASGLSIGAGPGLPERDSWQVAHPAAARGAGFALALAAAPGLVLAGAPHAGCGRTGCDTGQAHLAVRGHDGAWTVTEVACPDPRERAMFGAAVATDGGTLVVASPREGSAAWDAGTVDIYERDATQPAAPPRHVARLRSPAPAPSARFGDAVAIAGDWIAIGEPGANDPGGAAGGIAPGAVHLARRVGGTWSITASLRASAGDGGWLGAGLALAGEDLVAGAPVARDPASGARIGAALHFQCRDGAWTLRRVLRVPGLPAGAGLGSAVALSDGALALGAPGDDRHGEDAGAAFVGSLRGGRLARIDAPSPAAGAGFGAGLAFGTVSGWAPEGPRRFLAVASHLDPEVPPIPGAVELFGYREPEPVLLAGRAPCPAPPAAWPAAWPAAPPASPPASHPASPQSRSASAIAIAADASVTRAGAHPAASSRASASGP